LIRVFSAQGKAILKSSHILTELSEICTGAVIIERGKVLRAGPLDRILANGNGKHGEEGAGQLRTYVLRPLGDVAAVHRLLLELPGVHDARLDEREVLLDLDGGDEIAADILSELIRRGHRIAELRAQRANLEQVFMTVTTGGVQ
jgi:ABC-2 type transport system ATP-binding protein